jgi:hypothetical protein
MKRFLSVLFVTLLVGQTMNAQTDREETDLMQSIFGMEKKAIVADFIGIESDNPFWVLYDEYETKRKELGKERLVLLMDYAENYDSLDDAKYDEIIGNVISLQKRTDKLIDQYYKKIKKSSGSKIAAQFFQLEGYFLTQIRAAIFEEIPYIGEFGN